MASFSVVERIAKAGYEAFYKGKHWPTWESLTLSQQADWYRVAAAVTQQIQASLVAS